MSEALQKVSAVAKHLWRHIFVGSFFSGFTINCSNFAFCEGCATRWLQNEGWNFYLLGWVQVFSFQNSSHFPVLIYHFICGLISGYGNAVQCERFFFASNEGVPSGDLAYFTDFGQSQSNHLLCNESMKRTVVAVGKGTHIKSGAQQASILAATCSSSKSSLPICTRIPPIQQSPTV